MVQGKVRRSHQGPNSHHQLVGTKTRGSQWLHDLTGLFSFTQQCRQPELVLSPVPAVLKVMLFFGLFGSASILAVSVCRIGAYHDQLGCQCWRASSLGFRCRFQGWPACEVSEGPWTAGRRVTERIRRTEIDVMLNLFLNCLSQIFRLADILLHHKHCSARRSGLVIFSWCPCWATSGLISHQALLHLQHSHHLAPASAEQSQNLDGGLLIWVRFCYFFGAGICSSWDRGCLRYRD